MTKGTKSFRVQVRCSNVEDGALFEDLSRFTDRFDRAGRIRFLLRLGLAAAQAAFAPSVRGESHPNLALKSTVLTSPTEQIDQLIASGLGIQQFVFAGDEGS